MSIRKNVRKSGTTYTAIVRKGPYRKKPLQQTFSTKGEAEFWKADQYRLIEMRQHRDPRLADRVSLSEALEKYAIHGEQVLKKAASTLEREKYSKKHLERLIGSDTPLSEIDGDTVAAYQDTRIAEDASASAIRQELAMISRMFRVARTKWKLPIENPVEDIDRITPNKGRMRFLSEKEALLITSEARKMRNKKFYVYILILMQTGMRSGEAARLNIDDLNLERQLITIKETKTDVPRTVGISKELAKDIKQMPIEKDGYLFLKPHHRKSSRTMLQPGLIFRQSWQSLASRLGNKVGQFRPHDLRHTAGSHLLRQGIDIRIIADILGHSTLQMVMKYTHLFDDSKVKYANKISYLGREGNNEQPI